MNMNEHPTSNIQHPTSKSYAPLCIERGRRIDPYFLFERSDREAKRPGGQAPRLQAHWQSAYPSRLITGCWMLDVSHA
jgi:hypothetical protein